MKFHKTVKFLSLLFVFCLGLTIYSQTKNDFTSYVGGFSIDLPSRTNGGGGNGTAGGVNFLWRQPEAEYEIGFYEIEGLPSAKVEGDFSFDEMVKRYLNKFSAKGEKIYNKDILIGEFKGREYKYKTASAVFLVRLYAVGDNIYRLLAEIPLKNAAQEEKVLKVFDSFRLLDQKEVKAVMDKKLADATPKDLPQTPLVAKVQTDLQDKNLTGKVKSVLSETVHYGLNKSLRRKHPTLYEEFGENGNLIKEIEYNSYGNPFNVRVFGYVAGKRVSRTGSVSYETDIGGIALDFPSDAKFDERFTEYYTYKYTGKNLTEEKTFFSNNFLFRRAVHRYRKGIVETAYYDGGDEPYQKVISKLDEKGNEIEIEIDDPGAVFKKIVKLKIEYQNYDEQGNWTKRTVYEWYGFDDKGTYQPEYIEYRTIGYYD